MVDNTFTYGSAHYKTGTLLFVEDDSDLRKRHESFSPIKRFYYILSVIDGQDAFQKLIDLDFQVDLIVTDIHMPNMTGIEFANSIKK